MILGSITATCLTYLDCTDHKATDVWGVDKVRSKINVHRAGVASLTYPHPVYPRYN